MMMQLGTYTALIVVLRVELKAQPPLPRPAYDALH